MTNPKLHVPKHTVAEETVLCFFYQFGIVCIVAECTNLNQSVTNASQDEYYLVIYWEMNCMVRDLSPRAASNLLEDCLLVCSLDKAITMDQVLRIT